MEKEIDIKLYEETINEIFPGLTMHVRDADLSAGCAERYEPGLIIKERAYTDASCRIGGMIKTHRYAILSNHMADLSPFEQGTDWGLFVANAGSHFKVLDVYEVGGHTQILLLHLPDDDRWRLFKDVTLSIEKQIIEDCRKRFENKVLMDPVPELCTQEWLERCEFPLGMNESGILFDVGDDGTTK